MMKCVYMEDRVIGDVCVHYIGVWVGLCALFGECCWEGTQCLMMGGGRLGVRVL